MPLIKKVQQVRSLNLQGWHGQKGGIAGVAHEEG